MYDADTRDKAEIFAIEKMSFSTDILEFERLLGLIAQNAQTPMGKEILRRTVPKTDRTALDEELTLITEAIGLNEEKQVTWSFSGLEDPTDAVAILKISNATLEPVRLLEIARLGNQAVFARQAIGPHKEFYPQLWGVVEQIPPSLLGVLDKINKKILPGGEIDDSASPELARLRREINSQRQRLTKSLESVIRNSGDAIQDQIVTMRNDRFVIPVKADFRGKVGGVAHGFSSSGQTVFIEPLDAIEANNEIQNLKGKEEREISNILSGLTAELRGELPAVEAAVDAVGKLDVIKTKVEFARKFKAVVPSINDDLTLELTDARHPLLEENLRSADGKEIVPSTFSLTKQNSVMIISGANAGGKTVVLKTAGLLSLMAISGLPVPASSAKIPFYRSILADIGDHQSLSANLSTFSSHMSNIASMLEECRPPSLVLLDEAGTGTDPEEGSALGVAIVDHFRRNCGAQVIASTHYRGLKMYAANDADVINASVEFDEKTLQPTYKLLLGLAGASSGIEIASRFGILPEVIANARENMDVSAQDVEAYLRRLQTETTQAADLRIALEEEREAVAMKYAGIEIEADKRERQRIKEFEAKLAQAVNDFDRQSTAFIKTIEDKALKTKLEKERVSRKAELNRAVMSKMQDVAGKQMPEISSAASPQQHVIKDAEIKVGSSVLTSFGNVGTVEKIDKDSVEVLVGGMRLRQKLSDLRVVETVSAGGSRLEGLRSAAKTSSVALDTKEIAGEINLIGRTTSEADYELDRFIDEAYMAAMPRVRIIHGHGTGALKNFVQHFLKNHELVAKISFASADQGGNGVTIAEIRL